MSGADRLAARAALAALAILGAGCGTGPAPGPPPNIVLISIDSLRPDHLGLYGSPRPTSPEIDRLGGESIVFDRAWSTTTWTLPSHLSMLTGLVPSAHGVRGHDRRLPERADLLPELLAARGYRSAAVVSGPFLNSRYGYAQGWESYDDELAGTSEKIHDYDEITSASVHERALRLLDGFGEGPFLLFLHYFDVHYDYVPPAPWDSAFDPGYEGEVDGRGFVDRTLGRREMPERDLEHLVALYDGEIRWVDGWIGELLAELRRRGLLDRSVVVITADHGDEFLEHGRFGHANNLYDTTLRVPLLLHLPGGRRGGERISAPASLVDLVPTLLALAGIEAPSGLDGRDLLGATTPRPVFAELFGNRHAVVSDRWKALMVRQRGRFSAGRTRLFDLASDPGETTDVGDGHPAIRSELLERMRFHAVSAQERLDRLGTETAPRDEEFEARLRALGYL